MSCFWRVVLFLTFAFSCNYGSSEARKSSSAVVVVGTVYCDTCLSREVPDHGHFIAGASVAVECKDEASTSTPTTFRQQVLTDDHGQFRVKLPFRISKHARKIKGCSVKLISSNRPYCSIAAVASSTSLHLRSRESGTHIFSAGFFTFKPLNTPTVCDQKPNIDNNDDDKSIKKLDEKNKLSPYLNPDDPSFPPPLRDPTPSDPPGLGHLLPPLPGLPPLIPQLPPLHGIPFLPPKPKKGTDNKPSVNINNNDEEAIDQTDSFPFFPPNPLNPPNIFPPNPFQPPPSLIPPILPTPPPSIFPPILPTPSPPPFFKLPPLPGLTPLPGLIPSPPPPPPPVFPIPLPPFPFQPTPGFPGVPPAEATKRKSP